MGDEAELAASLKFLGNVAFYRGDYQGARSLYEESRVLREKLGDARGQAENLNNMGAVARYSGELEEASEMLVAALMIFRGFGDRGWIGRVLLNLGEVRLDQGEFERAKALIREGTEIWNEVGSRWDMIDLFDAMAYAVFGLTGSEDAARFYGAAAKLREVVNAPLPPSETEAYERRVHEVRDALGEDRFEKAFEGGKAMSYEEAVRLALTC